MGRLSDYINGSGSGIKFSVDEGAIELNVKNIEGMMTDNPELREKLRVIISEDLKKARNAVANAIPSPLKNGDPNEARRAVRRIVSQKFLGGFIHILDGVKKGTAKFNYRQRERAEAGIGSRIGRGGNRRRRTQRTAELQGYEGKARGFILRMVDSGTGERNILFKSNPDRKTDKWNNNPNTGNRGSIAARNFFEPMASAALNVVSQHLAQIIEEEIANAFNENNNE